MACVMNSKMRYGTAEESINIRRPGTESKPMRFPCITTRNYRVAASNVLRGHIISTAMKTIN